MKRLYAILSVLLLQLLPAAGSNPYDLDDECYALFRKVEMLVGEPGFEDANSQFLRMALAKSDTKSQTLY